MDDSTKPTKRPPHQTLPCPSCGKLFVVDMTDPAMPFCSQRCKMVDLYRWMDEDIGLPCAPRDEEDAEPEEPPPIREWNFD